MFLLLVGVGAGSAKLSVKRSLDKAQRDVWIKKSFQDAQSFKDTTMRKEKKNEKREKNSKKETSDLT